MSNSNSSIVYFSENIFDREIYKSSEIKTMIDNLIKTINLFNLSDHLGKVENKIINFGIASNKDEFNELPKFLGKQRYKRLIDAISKIDEEEIYKSYPDIAKYPKKYREII